MSSFIQENYLKCIYGIIENNPQGANTNVIAEKLNTKAATVTDMLKKLAEKKYIHYEKYKAVTLTTSGKKLSLSIIRKHRLWEFFLYEKLGFSWDKIHDVAEQLEHIQSNELTDKLDAFLGFPNYDPHGDPIPNKQGKIPSQSKIKLSEWELNKPATIVGVNNATDPFLNHLNHLGLAIGKKVVVKSIVDFDGSLQIMVNNTNSMFISQQVANNILIK
jgi:DtxR family Mn-dependent transcriptional regulator